MKNTKNRYYIHIDTSATEGLQSGHTCTQRYLCHMHTQPHTHAYTHNQTSKTFKQISSFWVPLRGLFQLEFPGPHKADQRGGSGTPPSSWDSCRPSREAEGVLVVGEVVNWFHFL